MKLAFPLKSELVWQTLDVTLEIFFLLQFVVVYSRGGGGERERGGGREREREHGGGGGREYVCICNLRHAIVRVIA